MSQAMLDAALRYAGMGFKIIPVKGNRAFLKEWPAKATTDRATIQTWWREYPDSNVGLVPDGSFCIVDVDPRNGGDELAAAIEQQYGPMPETVMSITGGGGTHQYYRVNPLRKLRYKPGRFFEPKREGIEVLGVGRAGVEWPSIHHQTQKVYQWHEGHAPWETEMAPGPEWIYEPIGGEVEEPTPPPPTNGHATATGDEREYRYCRRALDGARQELGGVLQGGRNQALNDTALSLASLAHYGAFTQAEAFTALRAACEANGLMKEDGFKSFEATFNSGWKAGLGKAREVPPPDQRYVRRSDSSPREEPPPAEPDDYEGEPVEAPKRTRARPRDKYQPDPALNPIKFVTATDLDLQSFPPVEWIIDDLLATGLTLFAGKSKIGKSWAAFDIAISVASGQPVFNKVAVNTCSVLYCALEDPPRRLQSRMRKLLGQHEVPNNLTFATTWPDMDNGCVERLDEFCDQHPDCRLIVIDTLGKIRGMPDQRRSVYQQDYHDMAVLHEFSNRRNLALLMIHHTRKQDASDVFDLVSGSTALIGAADTLMVLTRKRGKKEGVMAIVGRDITEDGDYAMDFDKPTGKWTLLGPADEIRAAEDETEIYNALLHSTDPMTAVELADLLGKTRGAVTRSLTKLKNKNSIIKLARGLYGIPGRHDKPAEATLDI